MCHHVFLLVPGDSFKGAVLGHEICGVVDVIGKEVPADCPLKVGYTVIVYPWRGCRQCEVRLLCLCPPSGHVTSLLPSFFPVLTSVLRLYIRKCVTSLYPYTCYIVISVSVLRIYIRKRVTFLYP